MVAALTVSKSVLVVYLLDSNLIRPGSTSTELFDQNAKVIESNFMHKAINQLENIILRLTAN